MFIFQIQNSQNKKTWKPFRNRMVFLDWPQSSILNIFNFPLEICPWTLKVSSTSSGWQFLFEEKHFHLFFTIFQDSSKLLPNILWHLAPYIRNNEKHFLSQLKWKKLISFRDGPRPDQSLLLTRRGRQGFDPGTFWPNPMQFFLTQREKNWKIWHL